MKNIKGEIVYTTSKIAEVYSVGNNNSQETESIIKEYIKEARLPQLSKEHLESLEDPNTEEEIERPIKTMKPAKSPGPDGFTIAYYKLFKDLIILQFCSYVNEIAMGKEIKK